jgi:hypothetical protein
VIGYSSVEFKEKIIRQTGIIEAMFRFMQFEKEISMSVLKSVCWLLNNICQDEVGQCHIKFTLLELSKCIVIAATGLRTRKAMLASSIHYFFVS